jgi:LacI family transcriptional regulator
MAKYYPTLKDVARAAGVSVSTVSRVSSDHPDVSEEARLKVKSAMADLGYRPSLLAQGLVSGHSRAIGLVVSNITNPFYPQLVGAIEEEASRQGYFVFLCNTYDDPERSDIYLDRLMRQGVDGIIHASVHADDGSFRSLVEREIPLVLVNRRSWHLEGIDMVVFDSRGGAIKASRHLLGLGHRNISMITGPLFISTEQERLAAFRAEMQAVHIPLPDEWIVHAETVRESGYQIGRRLLSQTPRPTAIISNDVVIYGILDAAQELSLEIPRDLSVVGFGQIESSNLGRRRLTSISSQITAMGRIGCQRLLDAIQNRDHQPTQTILEGELIDRGTTAPAPIADA